MNTKKLSDVFEKAYNKKTIHLMNRKSAEHILFMRIPSIEAVFAIEDKIYRGIIIDRP
jgi:hypothetical protein